MLCFFYREIMKNLSYLLEKMGSANTATITAGNVTGVMTKLPPVKESKSITVGITKQGDMNVCLTWHESNIV